MNYESSQDATNILGDKLHQKMDSIAFTQVDVDDHLNHQWSWWKNDVDHDDEDDDEAYDEDDDDNLLPQERMKRQMEALQERVSGAPSDIGDIRFDIQIFRVLESNQTWPGIEWRIWRGMSAKR